MKRSFDPSLLPPAPDLYFEERLWNAGISLIAGIDEAGRGALAGPVAAAALILPPKPSIRDVLDDLHDSKKLSTGERTDWSNRLRHEALAWGIGFATHDEIDSWGIIPATRQAAQRAMANLLISAEHLLLDYLFLPDCEIPQTALVKGDARSLSVAGASILAKTARDKLLVEMEFDYPGYGFAEHKGYGTPRHLQALDRLGPCPTHRYSFAPIKDRE